MAALTSSCLSLPPLTTSRWLGPNKKFSSEPLTCLNEVRKLFFSVLIKRSQSKIWETFKSLLTESWRLNNIHKNHGVGGNWHSWNATGERREKYPGFSLPPTLPSPVSVSHWLKLAGSHFTREPRKCHLHGVNPSDRKQSKSMEIEFEGKWSAYKLNLRKTRIKVLAK